MIYQYEYSIADGTIIIADISSECVIYSVGISEFGQFSCIFGKSLTGFNF